MRWGGEEEEVFLKIIMCLIKKIKNHYNILLINKIYIVIVVTLTTLLLCIKFRPIISSYYFNYFNLFYDNMIDYEI